MENEWEILDDYEWVSDWFVWLKRLNDFVNTVIYTFWTIIMLYTFWLFWWTKEMNFLGYYVFLYSLTVQAIGLAFFDDYLYFSAERKREEERRIRIEKAILNDHLYSVRVRTEKLIDKLRLYPSISEYVIASKRTFSPIQIMALLERERLKIVKQRLREMQEEKERERQKKWDVQELEYRLQEYLEMQPLQEKEPNFSDGKEEIKNP